MNAILYRMAVGIAGNVNRVEQATIESQQYDTDYPCLKFGILTKLVSGKIRPIANADVIANVLFGFLVRPYPIQTTQNDALGAAVPDTTRHADILRRGYMTVYLKVGTGSKGGQLYCYKTTGGSGTVGDFGDGADSANAEAVTGAYFVGPADANGMVEIAFNL